MREKRQKKSKKNDGEAQEKQMEAKHKKIEKIKPIKKKKDSDDEHQQYAPEKDVSKNEEEKQRSNLTKKKEKLNPGEIQEEKREKAPQKKPNSIISQSKLTSLVKLNENFQEIKAIHQQNIAKYQYHKSEFKNLGQKVNESNSNIEKKAKELRELSKSIYTQAIRANRQEFLNPQTFQNSNKLEGFIKNLIALVETLANCPYEDPLEKFKLTKLHPQSITISKKFNVGQHKKQKIIKDYLSEFPYITIGQECIPLIRALLDSTKYFENQSSLPIQQFPSLFIRESGISFSVIQKAVNILYQIITEDEKKVIKGIYTIIQQMCKQISDTPLDIISELVFKGLSKLKLINLPQVQFQIRGFSYGGSLYINTYYIEKDPTISKQVYVAYCVLTALRQLANFVVNSLIYCLNKNDEDIGNTIEDIRKREDPGSKLEKMLTGGHDFVCASGEDYNLLTSALPIDFEALGKNNSEFSTSFVFEEERKRKETITSTLFSKYDVSKDKKDEKDSQINKLIDHPIYNEERKIDEEKAKKDDYSEEDDNDSE